MYRIDNFDFKRFSKPKTDYPLSSASFHQKGTYPKKTYYGELESSRELEPCDRKKIYIHEDFNEWNSLTSYLNTFLENYINCYIKPEEDQIIRQLFLETSNE